jgi:hypothetical protein
MPVTRPITAAVAVVLFGSIPLALAQTRFHKVDLNLDVTWTGKRGVGIPIRPGTNQTLKGLCPPVIEVNSKFDSADGVPVEARYSFSDGRTLERKQTTFMGGLATEAWEIPITKEGQSYQGSVTLHITSPATDQNDVVMPFSVACSSAADATSTCDTTGNSCHAGVQAQLATPVTMEASPEVPPTTGWTGGTLAAGTYVLSAAKQYTFKGGGITVNADPTPGQMTVVLRKTAAGESAEIVTSQKGCLQRETYAVAHNPKAVPGTLAPAYESTFSGPRAITLSATCPPQDGTPFALPAAYSVTATGFRVMLLTGTALTFTRTP